MKKVIILLFLSIFSINFSMDLSHDKPKKLKKQPFLDTLGLYPIMESDNEDLLTDRQVDTSQLENKGAGNNQCLQVPKKRSTYKEKTIPRRDQLPSFEDGNVPRKEKIIAVNGFILDLNIFNKPDSLEFIMHVRLEDLWGKSGGYILYINEETKKYEGAYFNVSTGAAKITKEQIYGLYKFFLSAQVKTYVHNNLEVFNGIFQGLNKILKAFENT